MNISNSGNISMSSVAVIEINAQSAFGFTNIPRGQCKCNIMRLGPTSQKSNFTCAHSSYLCLWFLYRMQSDSSSGVECDVLLVIK